MNGLALVKAMYVAGDAGDYFVDLGL